MVTIGIFLDDVVTCAGVLPVLRPVNTEKPGVGVYANHGPGASTGPFSLPNQKPSTESSLIPHSDTDLLFRTPRYSGAFCAIVSMGASTSSPSSTFTSIWRIDATVQGFIAQTRSTVISCRSIICRPVLRFRLYFKTLPNDSVL